jgi:hypothetical protein
MINIHSASIKKMLFNVKANQNVARGKMRFYYDNLNIQVLKRDERSGRLQQQGFVSGVANLLVIHGKNPNPKGKFTGGTIYYKRAPTTSFFSFIWQSLFSGIKESVGLSKAREDHIQNTTTRIKGAVVKVGGFIENIKQKRADGKLKRERRRREKKNE